jgi:beta-glucosidase
VNSRYFVTVEEGLENAGFTVSSKYWLDTYESIRCAARAQFMAELKARARQEHKMAALEYMGVVMPEPDYTIGLKTRQMDKTELEAMLAREYGSKLEPVKKAK